MPGATEAQELLPESLLPGHGFTVFSQKVDIDVDFATKTVKGKTEITIQPTVKDLKIIRLNCRQCSVGNVWLEGKQPSVYYEDPYERLTLHPLASVQQHHHLRKRVDVLARQKDDELSILLPKSMVVEELDLQSSFAAELMLARGGAARDDANGPTTGDGTSAREDTGPMYKPIHVVIEYEIDNFRDGLYFAGLSDEGSQYPHVYTRNSPIPGQASCIFPCVDTTSSKCSWEFSIRCPKTLGDAFPKSHGRTAAISSDALSNGVTAGGVRAHSPHDSAHEDDMPMTDLTEEERNLDFLVVCSGDMTDEIDDPLDHTKKVVSFSCPFSVAPHHVGFAIGPFEHIDLNEFRDPDQDEKLGQSATRVHAFALPKRAEEVRNTCMTLAGTLDFFTVNFGSYPFGSYKLCFVEDIVADIADTASLSICSTRLLFPEDVIDPLEDVTRTLTNALASQWLGVHIGPAEPEDWWLIIGGALYMTDMFLRELFGKNDYRFRQKMTADKVADMDHQRPSVRALGRILHIDPDEMEFMKLKAPAILFILNQRLIKASGRNGITRCLTRLLLNAKTNKLPNNAISTEGFFHLCEKIGHMRLESFAAQWVHGAGCPHFYISQRFNKKKMHVELLIQQQQMSIAKNQGEDLLTSQNFIREVKEERHEAYAGPIQPVFSGPMTIRIHEADGTPYEHIIDIRESITKAEIPYYTKYKRLKRSKRQKERAAAAAGVDAGEGQDDVLIYCLGDVLQTESEVKDWQLTDWPKEDEDKMGTESYEWIRIDADFEWLGRIQIAMEDYMFVSQLQQDKDVVAQVDSVRWLSSHHKTLKPLYATFLTRTLMDSRYFHGIRTLAARALVNYATQKDGCQWVGKYHLQRAFTELFCTIINGKVVSKSNDFSDRRLYIIRHALIEAMARIRGEKGKIPLDVARFILDRLKDNDNTGNQYLDNFYVAKLMDCLSKTLESLENTMGGGADLQAEVDHYEVQQGAISIINRYQRSDEWIPSYRNLYTTTALQCHLLLMEKGIVQHEATEFMQYARAGNSNIVRIKAFSCMTHLGMLAFGPFARYLFESIASEPSPWLRDQLHRVLARGLGQIATGELKEMELRHAPEETHDGFEIETGNVPQVKQDIAARKKSLEVAKAALKAELGSEDDFREAMTDALRSEVLGLTEIEDLLDVCTLLYDTKDSLLVTMRMPRYWRVRHNGSGRLTFRQTDKVRWESTKPKPPPAMPSAVDVVPSIEDVKLPIANAAQAMPPPVSTHSIPKVNGSLSPVAPKSGGFKLKFPGRTSSMGLPSGATTPSTPAPLVATPLTHQSLPTPPVRPSPAPSQASTSSRTKSLIVKLRLSPKKLKKLLTQSTNGTNGTHSSPRPSSHLQPPPAPASQSNSKKRSSDASSSTASAAAAALGWTGGSQPPAKKLKLSSSAGQKSESPSNSRSNSTAKPPSPAPAAAKSAFAGAAAALMGGGLMGGGAVGAGGVNNSGANGDKGAPGGEVKKIIGLKLKLGSKKSQD